jgi:hypothetical protein
MVSVPSWNDPVHGTPTAGVSDLMDKFRDQAAVFLIENGILMGDLLTGDPEFDQLKSLLAAELRKTHDRALADVIVYATKQQRA